MLEDNSANIESANMIFLLTLFPMGVGHECFFEEQIIIMLMQMEICSYKLYDNSLSSILKARGALVLHFVIEN